MGNSLDVGSARQIHIINISKDTDRLEIQANMKGQEIKQ